MTTSEFLVVCSFGLQLCFDQVGRGYASQREGIVSFCGRFFALRMDIVKGRREGGSWRRLGVCRICGRRVVEGMMVLVSGEEVGELETLAL